MPRWINLKIKYYGKRKKGKKTSPSKQSLNLSIFNSTQQLIFIKLNKYPLLKCNTITSIEKDFPLLNLTGHDQKT